MKKFYLLSTTLCFLISNIAYGELGSSKMGSSSMKSSPTIPEMKPLEKPESKQTKPTAPPPQLKMPQPVAQYAEYLHPGILVYMNGKWEGSDHLLNLPSNIGVYVTIVKPAEDQSPVSQEQLHREVAAILGKANIKAVTLAAEGRPPLPAFEIEIFLYPVERGYAAAVDGRLFESVAPERFKLDPNMAYQAITWEKQSLIVGPKHTFADQLLRAAQDIANAFVERYQAYEKIKQYNYH